MTETQELQRKPAPLAKVEGAFMLADIVRCMSSYVLRVADLAGVIGATARMHACPCMWQTEIAVTSEGT